MRYAGKSEWETCLRCVYRKTATEGDIHRLLPVVVVNPRQVRDFARATEQHAKTDRTDAEILARFADTVRPAPRTRPTVEAQELDVLLTRRHQLLEMLGAGHNRSGQVFGSGKKPVKKSLTAHIVFFEKGPLPISPPPPRGSREFVPWYNHEHQHSAIRFVTPENHHAGREAAILAEREVVYARARQQHLERWNGATHNWTPVTTVGLKPTKDDMLAQERRAA